METNNNTGLDIVNSGPLASALFRHLRVYYTKEEPKEDASTNSGYGGDSSGQFREARPGTQG